MRTAWWRATPRRGRARTDERVGDLVQQGVADLVLGVQGQVSGAVDTDLPAAEATDPGARLGPVGEMLQPSRPCSRSRRRPIARPAGPPPHAPPHGPWADGAPPVAVCTNPRHEHRHHGRATPRRAPACGRRAAEPSPVDDRDSRPSRRSLAGRSARRVPTVGRGAAGRRAPEAQRGAGTTEGDAHGRHHRRAGRPVGGPALAPRPPPHRGTAELQPLAHPPAALGYHPPVYRAGLRDERVQGLDGRPLRQLVDGRRHRLLDRHRHARALGGRPRHVGRPGRAPEGDVHRRLRVGPRVLLSARSAWRRRSCGSSTSGTA